MRQINKKSLDLLKTLEGRRLVSYQDQGGVWTCGYGSTGDDVTKNTVWSPQEAEDRLMKDLQKFETIDHFISEQVNDNQFGALVLLCYNVGLASVKLSQTLKLVNQGKNPDKEWMGFNKIRENGVLVESKGLTNRRKAELQLYHSLG
jgi:lysozyme